jgi:anti-sigma factor RsiW
MTCDEFNAQLADFVGGELDAAARSTANAHMEQCPDCAREANELLQVAGAVRDTVSRTEGIPLRSPPLSAAALGFSHRAAGLLRYAAVVLIAFAAGYGTRLWLASPQEASPVVAETNSSELAVAVSDRVMTKYSRATHGFPDSSPLSWSLISLAR